MARGAKEKGNSYLSGVHIYKNHECPQHIVSASLYFWHYALM